MRLLRVFFLFCVWWRLEMRCFSCFFCFTWFFFMLFCFTWCSSCACSAYNTTCVLNKDASLHSFSVIFILAWVCLRTFAVGLCGSPIFSFGSSRAAAGVGIEYLFNFTGHASFVVSVYLPIFPRSWMFDHGCSVYILHAKTPPRAWIMKICVTPRAMTTSTSASRGISRYKQRQTSRLNLG